MKSDKVQHTNLKKDSLGVLGAVAMGICGAAPALCIGGTFGLLVLQTRTGISLAALLATLVMLLVGISYSSLCAKHNSCGGNFSYINAVLGPKVGTWSAFVYFFVFFASSGCPPTVFNIYLNNFIEIPAYVTMLFFVVPMVFIALTGVEMNTRILVLVWIVQMVLLIWPPLVIIQMSPEELDIALAAERAFVPGLGLLGLSNAVLIWIWSYIGFEIPAFMGEELRGGVKAVRKAIILSVLGVGGTYMAICWLWTAKLTPEHLNSIAGAGDAVAMICHLFSYAVGAKAISIAAMISCWASALAFYSMMPRFLYDLGRKGILPKPFTVLNKKQIPQNGVIAYGVSAMVACLYGSYAFVDGLFDGVNDFFTVQAITASIAYVLICVSHIKEEAHNTRLFKGIIVAKIIPLISISILIYLIYSSGPRYVIFTVFWMGLAWLFMRSRSKVWRGGAAERDTCAAVPDPAE